MIALPNGLVLVTCGCSTGGLHLAAAELYNYRTHEFTSTGSMTAPRYAQTATLLLDGQVLVAGGSNSNGPVLSSAELYNPRTGTWISTGNMHTDRWTFIATLSYRGKVLVVGGLPICVPGDCNTASTVELYGPTTGTWTYTANLPTGLYQQAASRLLNGQVLLSGGSSNACPNSCMPTTNAELYNPNTGQWTYTAPIHTARENHTSTLLRTGQNLVAGGAGTEGTALASAERFDPATGARSTTSNMTANPAFHSATLLPSGVDLAAGRL